MYKLSTLLQEIEQTREAEEIEMSLRQHEQVRAHLRGFNIKKQPK